MAADALVAGKFGNAYNNAAAQADYQVLVETREAYRQQPLTVECWAKINSQGNFNIIIANEPKDSSTHWELYTQASSGRLALYMPGSSPADVVANNASVCDGQWHYLAAVITADRTILYDNGKEVANAAVTRPNSGAHKDGPLVFGQLTDQTLGCDGVIDEVRLSNVARTITAAPTAPFTADTATIGLWHFDETTLASGLADASALGNNAQATALFGQSLDEVDNKKYSPLARPMDAPATTVTLAAAGTDTNAPTTPTVVDLGGTWQLAAEGDRRTRLTGDWTDAIAAEVPGSVHTALVKAGKMPDPVIGKNQLVVREASFKTWWMKKTFDRPALDPSLAGAVWLRFDGICSACEVWLNGEFLGRHLGMFGGPSYEVSSRLKAQNTLVVKLDPAGQWQTDVVFNNVYGWHYCNIPSRGIWRPVRLEGSPAVQLDSPFVAARDAKKGVVDLAVTLRGAPAGFSGKLTGVLAPENFTGPSYRFEQPVQAETGSQAVRLCFTIPDPKLWWPNGLGEPNLYQLKLTFSPAGDGVADTRKVTFGLRTIQMAPLPAGKRINKYDWTFVVNGEPHFIKGNGWCTMDPLMNFSRERYDRFLSLAQAQHVQMLRAWGSGMPETDEFYDLCDRKGIMVLQEWPTAWDSHNTQPYDAMDETVRLNTIRLRNHPALAMYGGGNEVPNPFGAAIDMMGRYAIELDGTRVFHRTDPWGGSAHNYNCYWGDAPLDYNVTMTADFWGEFGLACMPALESVMRYLPENEKNVWPAPEDGSLWHHTPIFNTANDHKHLALYSKLFMPDDTLAHFITGSQISQATGLRHPLELARTRWPQCSGALYYKMNDNYPAASWSCADWFGVAKISQYINMDAFAPLHACAIFQSLNTAGQALSLPVWLLDDADALKDAPWEVTVRAYGADLQEVKRQSFTGQGSIAATRQLGTFTLTAAQNRSNPLLTVVEVKKSGALADRTFYWTNYEAKQGCLMGLPQTQLTLRREGGSKLIVKNTGTMPAVAVNFVCPEVSDHFLADDGYFWLDAGEERVVNVNLTDGVSVQAWNAPIAALSVSANAAGEWASVAKK